MSNEKVTTLEQITIAILTDYDNLFADLKRSDGNVKYIRIRDIEDVRGRVFDGYSVIGTMYKIKDVNELISIIESRLKKPNV